jgi:L-iditol 2-dehydrogenase
MLAVVKESEGVGAIGVREVAVPQPDGVRVEIGIRASAVCGSDLHIWHWAPPFHGVLIPPRIIGHEAAGKVIDDPAGRHAAGARVVMEAIRSCGRCPRCRAGRTGICESFQVHGVHVDGAMTERVLVWPELLHPIPDEMPFERAALIEPAAVATHAVAVRGDIKPGDAALVVGPGPIGLLVAQVARAAGATVVVAGSDADEAYRLPIAQKLGLQTLNTEREPVNEGLKRLIGRERVDAAFECAGAGGAFQAAVQSVEKGSTVVIVALYSGAFPFDPSVAVRRELDLRTTYSANWPDYERAIRLISSGAIDVEPLIARFPLTDALEAFHRALDRTVLKPVLIPATS